MSRGWARAALVGYRWFGAGLYPLLGPYLAIRAAKGKEERARRKERYGRSNIERPIGPLVWFHAASVGETSAVVPLIKEVRRRGIAVVLTTGTVTSAGVGSFILVFVLSATIGTACGASAVTLAHGLRLAGSDQG